VAKRTNSLRMYKFLYHATSRSVHFSVGELLRRVWGSPGRVVATSAQLADYWAAFGLSWGVRLYLDTLIEVIGILPSGLESRVALSEDRMYEAARWIGEFGQVPIVVAEELQWPDE
jgi:hypothetical protein